MSVVKAQASISLALVSDGKTGPQGPAGKDITSYAQGTTLPTTVAPTNSQFWMVNEKGQCTAVYVSDGTKWVTVPISASLIVAATFKGMNFEGVTFTGSEFKTTYTNVANTVGDSGTKFTGTGKFAGPELVFDSMTDDTTPQAVRTAMAPEGFSAYAGKNAFGYFSAFGQMALGDANGYQGALDAEMLEQMNNVGNLLWSGALYMTASNTVVPSFPISKCLNGWLLAWGDYTNGAVSGAVNQVTPIWKDAVLSKQGKGFSLVLGHYTSGTTSSKYVYPSDTKIMGNNNNNNDSMVLWAVYAF